MSQPFDPMNPRTLPAPNQRDAWLGYFLPRHPWRSDPGGRAGFLKTSGLREREMDVLLAEFGARELEHQSDSPSRGATWSSWVSNVFQVRVAFFPGGRATLRQRGRPFFVTFRFAPTGRRVVREPELILRKIEVASDAHPPHLVPEAIELSVYFAAFILHMERVARPKARSFYEVAVEPAPGRPAATNYYALLLSEYEELKAQGHPSPAKELAERRGLKRPTVRGHLLKANELDRARRGTEEPS